MEIYEAGTELTAKGLGFPQYANDDVVIPALEKWGYETEDARDYSVAACWEFLVPGCGMDINNIDAVSFVGALDAALRNLAKCARDEVKSSGCLSEANPKGRKGPRDAEARRCPLKM